MINFRYHVVALTAVLAAIAIGLVLGAAAFTDARAGHRGDEGAPHRSAAGGGDRTGTARAAADRHRQEFVRRVAPRVLAGTLTGRAVTVVALPAADDGQVADTETMLGYAGAALSGEVRLTPHFTDPANADALADLASARLPVDIPPKRPGHADGVSASAALLAAVLFAGRDSVSADSRTVVLSAYRVTGDLSVRRPVRGAADAVLVLAGPPAHGRDAGARNTARLRVVRRLAATGATVLAGPGVAGRGNVLAAVRADRGLRRSVSTVDTLRAVPGRLVTVLAVARQLRGTTGSYGTGPGATALLPARD